MEMLKAKNQILTQGPGIISTMKRWFTRAASSSEATTEANVRIKSPYQKWHLTFRKLKNGLYGTELQRKYHQCWAENGLCCISAFQSCFSSSLWGTPVSPLGREYKVSGGQWLSFRKFLFLMYQHLIEVLKCLSYNFI